MDRIWLNEQKDLKMSCYTVMGTGCEQGWMEFNLGCVTLADMQHRSGDSTFSTFTDTTV